MQAPLLLLHIKKDSNMFNEWTACSNWHTCFPSDLHIYYMLAVSVNKKHGYRIQIFTACRAPVNEEPIDDDDCK